MKRNQFFILVVLILFGAKPALANDVNLIRLPDTVHNYTNYASNGGSFDGADSYAIDENVSTYQGTSYNQCPDCGMELRVISEHVFAVPHTIRSIRYQFSAQGWYLRESDYACSDWAKARVYYATDGGSYVSIYDNQSNPAQTSGLASYNATIPNVKKIKVVLESFGYAAGGAAVGKANAMLNEIQCWGENYTDIGLRVRDNSGTNIKIACEPIGTVTSPLRIRKGNVTYGIVLVDPSDPSASKVRIKTKDSGVKALAKLS